MWSTVWISWVIVFAGWGQPAPAAQGGGWIDDYRSGLRAELVEGDLSAAIAAYRRVAVSQAPADYNRNARYRCARALVRIGRPDEAAGILERLAVELDDPQSILRQQVVWQLEALKSGDEDRLGYWSEQLRRAIESHDVGRVREAAGFLAHQPEAESVEALLKQYRSLSPEDSLRVVMLNYLARAASPEVVQAIRDGLGDPRPELVAAAALAAGRLGDAESESRLIELFDSPDVEVRINAVRGLRMMQSLAGVPGLITLARDDPNETVRVAAIDALNCIGSPEAVEAVRALLDDGEPPECACMFSRWYRESRQTGAEVQTVFDEAMAAQSDAPVVGVVVSAMTHHAPPCSDLVNAYAMQVRKAWMLQRAGFRVVLLAEPEVVADPDAAMLPNLFQPALPVVPLGDWPQCDAIVMDHLFHLPREIVRTIHAYLSQGGRLVLCGAVCGGTCGDAVTWRQVAQVRRPDAHGFHEESVRLSWAEPENGGDLPWITPMDWLSPRHGTFYGHRLSGVTWATFDVPGIWAIKAHELGAGRAVCFNWDLGLAVEGSRDEDELLCRTIDLLAGDREQWTAVRYRMMRDVRWQHWSQAKHRIEPADIAGMPAEQQTETLTQLMRIYLQENNGPAGVEVARRLSESLSDPHRVDSILSRITAVPPVVHVAQVRDSVSGWYSDLPAWQATVGGAARVPSFPLWLSGPGELPAVLRIRVYPLPQMDTHIRLWFTSATPKRIAVMPGGTPVTASEGVYQVDGLKNDTFKSWVEAEVEMSAWDARLFVELKGTITPGTGVENGEESL